MSIEVIAGGGLFDVQGLRGAAVAAGVKPSGGLDVALIVAAEPMVAAGMFTRCSVAAAPVVLCRERLRQNPSVRSIVINSGNANALTGPQGDRDAEAMLAATEASCGGPALVLSTGVIGVPLPIERIVQGIGAAAARLDAGEEDAVARAILTTDSCTKQHAVRLGRGVVGGLAKGSGMIHPDMATMLAVIATDVPLTADAADALLRYAVDRSFHQISVDGDTSTNDAVLLLAPPAVDEASPADLSEVRQGIVDVARSLAEQILCDGEGVARTMDLRVQGAATEADARAIAASVARSPLVKTALAGGDPNWGRILAAVGNAGVAIAPRDITLRLGDQVVFARGAPVSVDGAALARAFAQERVHVALRVGDGACEGRMLTGDLTHRYVEINAEYTT